MGKVVVEGLREAPPQTEVVVFKNINDRGVRYVRGVDRILELGPGEHGEIEISAVEAERLRKVSRSGDHGGLVIEGAYKAPPEPKPEITRGEIERLERENLRKAQASTPADKRRVARPA